MKTVFANKIDFAYLEEGQGQMVLLLHGFPDTAHSWDAVRPALAKAGFRALSPFMRGYAPTEIPKDGEYGTETLSRDVITLIEETNKGNPAIVVAHDWGASAAYAAAALCPGLFRALITVALPHPAVVNPTPGILWGVRHFMSLRIPGMAWWIRRSNFAQIDELVKRWSPGWDVPENETAAVKECFKTPGSLEAAMGYYAAMTPWLPSAHRQKISVPTYTFAALNDGILGLETYEKAKSRFTGKYEVIPMQAGHFLHREMPDQFIEKLLEIVKEV